MDYRWPHCTDDGNDSDWATLRVNVADKKCAVVPSPSTTTALAGASFRSNIDIATVAVEPPQRDIALLESVRPIVSVIVSALPLFL